MEKILVIEDEPSISTLLKFNLEKAGFTEDGFTLSRAIYHCCYWR